MDLNDKCAALQKQVDSLKKKNKRLALKMNKDELQKALTESEKKFRLAFDSSAVGKSLSFVSGPFFRVNPKMCEILGYSSDELIGMQATSFTHPDDLEFSKQNIRNLMAGKCENNAFTIEKRYIAKNGQVVWANTTVSLLKDENQNPLYMIVEMIDITDRKKAEDMIIQSEKMIFLGGLSAGMAHEINNPLAGIIQNIQVVINRLTSDIPVNEKAAQKAGTDFAAIRAFMEERNIIKLLESAQAAGTRTAKIIQNMLSFARKSTSQKSPCDPFELLEKTLVLACSDYNLNNIKISKRYRAGIPKVLCEESKIQQVILNIVKNAAQALYGNPETLPEHPELVFTLFSESGRVALSIKDNGPGMDEQTKKRIFEPFFTTKPPGEGTGLGLPVSYFIVVEDHNGEMTVDSSPGKGTTFTIRLPSC